MAQALTLFARNVFLLRDACYRKTNNPDHVFPFALAVSYRAIVVLLAQHQTIAKQRADFPNTSLAKGLSIPCLGSFIASSVVRSEAMEEDEKKEVVTKEDEEQLEDELEELQKDEDDDESTVAFRAALPALFVPCFSANLNWPVASTSQPRSPCSVRCRLCGNCVAVGGSSIIVFSSLRKELT